MPAATLWIIDDDRSIRWVLEKALSAAGFAVESFSEASSALKRLSQAQPDALFSDIRMPGLDGLALLEQLHRQYPNLPVIIMTAHSDLASAVSAYQGGAFEYLPKPFDLDDAVTLARRAVAHRQEQQSEPSPLAAAPTSTLIGESPAMQQVFRAIGRLAQSSITVLINGESGTGKELVAQALHRHSPRAQAPFIALNMAAIPRELMEAELFGHEKGAFTGAGNQRSGYFEKASGGTLFLDEIGDMPLEAQTRLLRVLACGEFFRVGGQSPVQVDVRIIAATHQNLEKLVASGQFREDLFHRLNVIRIEIPPLRKRREDIAALARHFLKRAADELHIETKQLPEATAARLAALPWPGNVRQLENTCRWLSVMASGREILIDDLPDDLRENESLSDAPNWQEQLALWAKSALLNGHQPLLDSALPAFESVLIGCALEHCQGHRQEAAERLGWGRNTLTRKIKELNLKAPDDETGGAA